MQLRPEHILLGFFILVCCIQLYYYLYYFTALPGYKKNTPAGRRVPVSVIIVARNELQRIQAYLDSWTSQDYPEYEVILVDNGSWDGTGKYLETIAENYRNLKVVTIAEDEKYPKGKKFGLTLGIKAAKYDTFILTDADCTPAGPQWLSSMVAAYGAQTEIVLGYSPYLREKGTINLFIRFETLYTAMQYLSFAIKGKPYMGVGRNLSYRKDLFFRVKGFASHNHIISGDDDLFVNETATSQNTEIAINPESFVYSIPKKNFGDWFNQKRRHLSTGVHYKAADKRRLGFLQGSHVLVYFSLIPLAILFPELYIFFCSAFALRFIVNCFVFYSNCRKLKEKGLWFFWIVFDIFYPFYFLFTGFLVVTKRKSKNTWAFAY